MFSTIGYLFLLILCEFFQVSLSVDKSFLFKITFYIQALPLDTIDNFFPNFNQSIFNLSIGYRLVIDCKKLYIREICQVFNFSRIYQVITEWGPVSNLY